MGPKQLNPSEIRQTYSFLFPKKTESLNRDQLEVIERIFSEGRQGGCVAVDSSDEAFYQEMTRTVATLASKFSRKICFVSRSNILTFTPSLIEKDTYVVGHNLETFDQEINERVHRLIHHLFSSQGKLLLFSSSLETFIDRITLFHSGDRLKITSRLHDLFGIESRQIKHPLNRYIDSLPELSSEEIDHLLEKINVILKSLPKEILATLKPILEDKFDHIKMTDEYLVEIRSGNPSQDLQRLFLDFSFFKNNPWLPLENVFSQLGNFQCDTDSHKNLWLDIQEIDPLTIVGTYLIGQNGIGKTHLAVGKGKELMEKGFEVHFIQPQHAEMLLCKFQDRDRVMTSNAMTVWILDDFNSVTNCNPLQKKYFLDVIDLINKRGGIVIATSNLPFDELMTDFTRNLPERLDILTKMGEIFGLQFYINEGQNVSLQSKKRTLPVANSATAMILYEDNPYLRNLKLNPEERSKGDKGVILRLVEPGTTFALIDKMRGDSEKIGSQITHVLQTAYFESLNSSGQTTMIEHLQQFWAKVAIKLKKMAPIQGLEQLVKLIKNESISVQLSRYQPKDLLSLTEEQLDDILFTRSSRAQDCIRSFLPNRVLILTKYLNANLKIEFIFQFVHDSDNLTLSPFIKSNTHSTFIVKIPYQMRDNPKTAESILKLLENHYGVRNDLSAYGETSLKLHDYFTYISEVAKLGRENEKKLKILDPEFTLSSLQMTLRLFQDDSTPNLLNLEERLADLEKARKGLLSLFRAENNGYLAHHQTFGKMLHAEIRDWVSLEVMHGEIFQILTALFFNESHLRKKIPTWVKTVDHMGSKGFAGPSPSWTPTITHIEYSAFFSDPKKQDNIPERSYNLPLTSLLFYQQFFIEGNIKPMYRINAARLIWTARLFEKTKQNLAFYLDWQRFSEEISSIFHGSDYKGNPTLQKGQIWRKVHPDPQEMGLYPEDCSEWISTETGFKGYSVPDSEAVFVKFSDWQKYMNRLLLNFSG